ncbi:MAG: sulfatase [Alphaproteobacteria bacterium]|nr:sulfatase [Alphaproteobacteria bacterium]
MIAILWMLGCGGEPAKRAAPPALPAAASKAFTGERPPDVVLVSIDTLRPDHLGTYGYSRDTSPFVDGLAAKGVRFAHARSASPWTLPAHTTMLTGLLPTTHMVVEDDLRVPDATPVLPELLDRRGVHTGAAVSTLFVSAMYRFDRGFDHFNDFGIHDKKTNLQGVVDMQGVVDDLEAFVKSVPDGEPLFLFLHSYDVHYAYDPPAPYDAMFDRAPVAGDATYKNYFVYKKKPLPKPQMEHQIAQYDEAIRYVDDQLARLDRVLRDAGREVRWVITADHGEEFGERGSWGHAHTLYAEQLRVPLVVSGPGIPAGVVVEEPVGTHDLAPTLAAWTGVALPGADGIDLTPFLSGEVPVPARPFVAETSRHGTMRLGLWEGGKRLEWDLASGTREVFSDADPAEKAATGEDPAVLQARVIELLGTPFEATEAGAVAVRKGKLLVGGRAEGRAAVTTGMRFQTFPFDTPVRFSGADGKPGRAMALAGGAAPSGPLRVEGAVRPTDVDLDADTKAALETIGYIHGDDEDE